MLEMGDVKGTLDSGADADLVIFSEVESEGATQLVIDEVWKFGTRVHRREEGVSP
jgi:N-acetylglucosamine-6-phosphate deacetylase